MALFAFLLGGFHSQFNRSDGDESGTDDDDDDDGSSNYDSQSGTGTDDDDDDDVEKKDADSWNESDSAVFSNFFISCTLCFFLFICSVWSVLNSAISIHLSWFHRPIIWWWWWKYHWREVYFGNNVHHDWSWFIVFLSCFCSFASSIDCLKFTFQSNDPWCQSTSTNIHTAAKKKFATKKIPKW